MLRRSLIALGGLFAIVTACAKENDTSAAAPAPYVAPAPTAAPAPTVAQPAVTAATPAPVVAGTPAAAAMSTPGPLAPPCAPLGCGLAQCNAQFQKCVIPCVGPADCVGGATCNTMTGLCLPGGAPQ